MLAEAHGGGAMTHGCVMSPVLRCLTRAMTDPKEKGPPGEGGPKLRGRQQEESPGKDNGSL